jgi:hypothetical protein
MLGWYTSIRLLEILPNSSLALQFSANIPGYIWYPKISPKRKELNAGSFGVRMHYVTVTGMTISAWLYPMDNGGSFPGIKR